jgi:hypothetical protein
VTVLDFLSPSRCAEGTTASPLRRALEGAAGVEDRSTDGKLEVRGDLERVRPEAGEELVRLSPRRGFLLTPNDPADAAGRVRAEGVRAFDVSGGWAGLALEGEQLMRRLTDLDLDKLPAAGLFARVNAIVLRDEGERFRVYFPQELGHDVAVHVVDAIRGLETNP